MEIKILALTLKILTVDDSPIIAERMQFMLSDLNNVQYLGNAQNVDSALRLIEEGKPQVVILDINLKDPIPTNNGIGLLKRIKESYAGMSVIMFTNLTSTYYQSKCLELGADYFFDKSNDFNRIPEALSVIHHKLGSR